MTPKINKVSSGTDWIQATLDSGESFSISFHEDEAILCVDNIGSNKTVKCQKYSRRIVYVSIVDNE